MTRDSAKVGLNVQADMSEQSSVLASVFEHASEDYDVAHDCLTPSGQVASPLIVWLARGSSAHAIESVAPTLTEAMRIPWVRGDVSHHIKGDITWPEGTAFVIASQSGDTPDVVLAAKRLVHEGRRVLVTTNAGGALRDTSSFHIPLRVGKERAVPATKSVFGQIASLLALAANYSNSLSSDLMNEVNSAVTTASDTDGDEILSELDGLLPVASIGSGSGLGLAKEFAHKVQETSGLAVLSMDSAEFEHGPIAVCNSNNSVVAFHAGNTAATASAMRAITARGSRVLEIGQDDQLQGGWDLLPSLIQAQKLTMSIAISQGLDPDAAFGLSKVTNTTA